MGPIEVRDERGRRLRWDTADDGAISIRLRKGESGFGPAPDAEAEVRV
ncbi:hypothetical protein [Streptomyces lunaelactis]